MNEILTVTIAKLVEAERTLRGLEQEFPNATDAAAARKFGELQLRVTGLFRTANAVVGVVLSAKPELEGALREGFEDAKADCSCKQCRGRRS